MENKTTSELLDIIGKYDVKDRNEKEISDKETDDWVEAVDELITRNPFKRIFEEKYDETKESIEERLASLEENFEDFEKRMKRHKHDEKSGDVMIRI